MTDRKSLLKQIHVQDFAIQEVALFLDTHPRNEKALAYYQSYRAMRQKAVDEYEKLYGPLTIFGNESRSEWKWTESPWPWEMED